MHAQRRDDAALVDSLVLALLLVVASALVLLAPVGSTLRRLQKGTPPTSEARGDPFRGIASLALGGTFQAPNYKNARAEQSAATAADAASYRVQG